MGFNLVLEFVGLALVFGLSLGSRHHFAQERPKESKAADCAPTITYHGRECNLIASIYNEKILVACHYDCESNDSYQCELTAFDKLPVEEQKAILSNKGPLLPAWSDTNDISMRALIGDDSPFYISHSLKGSAVLTIAANDIEPFSQELKAGEKMQTVFKLPERFGSELRVAQISLKVQSGSEFELYAIGILEKGKSSKKPNSRYWILQFPDGQQRIKKDTVTACDTTAIMNGQKCVIVDPGCSSNVRVCSYDCASSDDHPSGPPSQVQPDLAAFDKLSVEVQKATLFSNGPLLPARFDMNDMSMRAFVRNNWPFYVLYSLNEGSAVLTISANDIGPFSQVLKAGEKIQAVFKLPERFGSELRVGQISLTAQSGSEFELHAIGILEKGDSSKNHHSHYWMPAAVEVPISDVTVTPNKISTSQREKISYWFFSRSLYSSGAAEFFLFGYTSKHGIVPTRVYSSRYENIKENEKTTIRQWDGRNWIGQFSFGVHRLQIRTWRGQGSSGQWFGPYYGPKVEVVQ